MSGRLIIGDYDVFFASGGSTVWPRRKLETDPMIEFCVPCRPVSAVFRITSNQASR